MKRSLFYCCILFALTANIDAQKKKAWKKYLFTCSSAFVSGAMDGTIEAINYHYYDGFKLRCPKANDQYWDPALSWKNKYKNYDPQQGEKFAGSTTFFVAATDGYHVLRGGKRCLEAGALAWYMNDVYCDTLMTKKRKFKKVIFDFLLLSAVRSVGFHFTYSWMFRKQG
jgi:hypothetical protein